MAVTIAPGSAGRSEVIGTGTAPTVGEPTAAKSGDVLFAFFLSDLAGAIAAPSGWTPLFPGSASAVAWNAAMIRRGEVSPSLTFPLTGSVYREVYITCLQKQDALVLLHALSAAGAVTASSTVQPNPPPVTVTVPSALVLCFGLNFGATGTWACAGYTVQTANAAADDGAVFSKAVGAGIEDPPLWSGVTTAGNLWDGGTVAFTDVPILTPAYQSSPAVIKKQVPRQQRSED